MISFALLCAILAFQSLPVYAISEGVEMSAQSGRSAPPETATATDAKGNETDYTYDAMGRTLTVASSDANVAYTYANDMLDKISVDGGAVQYNFDYDSFSRNIKITLGNSVAERTLATFLYNEDLLSRQYYGNNGSSLYIDFDYDDLDRPFKSYKIRANEQKSRCKASAFLFGPLDRI